MTFTAAALGAVGCVSDNSSVVGLDDPDPEVCSASWQVVYSPRQAAYGIPPKVLRWHDGRLFTAPELSMTPGIISVPDTGGESSTIEVGDPFDFWIEGDQILRATSGPSQKVDGIDIAPLWLYRTPIAGGDSEVVLQTHIFDAASDPLVLGFALDADALYWVRDDYSHGYSAWRAGRDGSGDQKLADLVESPGAIFNGLPDVTIALADRLIIYSSTPRSAGSIFSVPKTGTGQDAVLLPTAPAATVIGVMADGTVLLQSYAGGANGQKRSDHYQMQRLRPGATALEPFWEDKPAAAFAVAGWDDGNQGALLSVWEWGTDDALHTTVWAIDAAGQSRRLACDPVAMTNATVGAVSPDAIFLVAEVNPSYWQLVRVPR